MDANARNKLRRDRVAVQTALENFETATDAAAKLDAAKMVEAVVLRPINYAVTSTTPGRKQDLEEFATLCGALLKNRGAVGLHGINAVVQSVVETYKLTTTGELPKAVLERLDRLV